MYIHHGGYFKNVEKPPTRVYTGKEVKVFENWNIDYICLDTLLKIYHTVEDSFYAKLYYQVLYCDLDVGVVLIDTDVDIELLITAYKGML